MTFLGVGDFCGDFLGVTSNFDIFMGYFLKSTLLFVFCDEIYAYTHHNCH